MEEQSCDFDKLLDIVESVRVHPGRTVGVLQDYILTKSDRVPDGIRTQPSAGSNPVRGTVT